MEIEVKNLNKKFDNILAVNNLNFKIKKNKTLGLLGPNGCGKTTTIGMMLGLIKPSNGQIIINNFDINKTDKNLILKYINFASPYVELPKKLTVRENLEVYARLYDIPKINDRISELVDELSLNKFIDKKSGELSSGQKNRVSLAKSLINKPKILFLDEPTASLDPDIGDFVRNYITEYKKQNDVTILLASHNMDEVEKLCDSIVMMKLGEIVDRGTCQDLINKHGRNNLEETFLKIARSNNELE
jgi:ABC-2 type transport system ATP-binding protein|tara:strand:- start:246 stop:980 length:735 start_codon:yes stop_codon:yes gene_type:complete